MPKENYNYKYKFKISIILSTYQSFSSLSHSLSNILLQQFPRKHYEVIAIAHGVSDANTGFLMNCVQNKKTMYIENNDRGYRPCNVRNQAIEKAEGRLVFFLHDNVNLIGRDYLTKLWKYSGYGKKGVVTTKVVYKYTKNGSIDYHNTIHGFYAQQDAVPLKYLKLVGGFDEIYDGDKGYDDIDLFSRCQNAGCEFYDTKPYGLVSIRHNMSNLYPEIKVGDGSRNYRILCERGFSSNIPDELT